MIQDDAGLATALALLAVYYVCRGLGHPREPMWLRAAPLLTIVNFAVGFALLPDKRTTGPIEALWLATVVVGILLAGPGHYVWVRNYATESWPEGIRRRWENR